jgi:predicted acyl esterase
MLNGPGAFNFFASIDTDDTNWIVRVTDVPPAGREARVGSGMLKASHRAVNKAKSRPYDPVHPHTSAEPVTPGEIVEYNVSLGNMINLFRAGHRIGLEITSLISPRDPEIQIHYHPILNSARTTLHKIYRNADYRSHIVLPITSGKESVNEILSDENFQGGV